MRKKTSLTVETIRLQNLSIYDNREIKFPKSTLPLHTGSG